ncbi:MAG: glycosyltransferase family 2 protein [Promethearchaeota archaeon]
MEEPLVSLIITNYNGLKHIKGCLDSIYNLNYNNIEVIFVDDCSTDKSIDYVKTNYKDIKIIQNKKNLGFSGSNSLAATYANGKYLGFLNIDIVLDQNWLTELVKVAELSPEYGFVVGKHYYYHDKLLINFAGSCTDKYMSSRHIGRDRRDNKIYNTKNVTFYACFAAVLMRKSVYNKIGLFEPLYYIYSEDLDVSWRTWLAGYKVIYVPTSIMYHKEGQIMGNTSPRKKFWIERNKFRTILKNYQLKTLVKILPLFTFRRFGSILKKTLKLDKSAAVFAVVFIKSYMWNLLHLRSMIKNRKFIKSIRKRDDKFIFKLMKKTIYIENLGKKE